MDDVPLTLTLLLDDPEVKGDDDGVEVVDVGGLASERLTKQAIVTARIMVDLIEIILIWIFWWIKFGAESEINR